VSTAARIALLSSVTVGNAQGTASSAGYYSPADVQEIHWTAEHTGWLSSARAHWMYRETVKSQSMHRSPF
jgi:hypothetical protein